MGSLLCNLKYTAFRQDARRRISSRLRCGPTDGPDTKTLARWGLAPSVGYSKTRDDVSRNHSTQVDATNRERRPWTKLIRIEYPWFCSRPRSFPVDASPCGSASNCNRREKPPGPVPPATASAGVDSFERPGRATRWAASESNRRSGRRAYRYGSHPPGRQPIPPDRRREPAIAPDASPAARYCAQIGLKAPDRVPHSSRTGERRPPRHRN